MSGNDLVDDDVAKKARLRALGGFFSLREGKRSHAISSGEKSNCT